MRRLVSMAAYGALALTIGLSASRADEQTAPQSARQCVSRGGVLVIAHRGDSGVAPENTLPAFASAVKADADLVELDYLHSADAVPVVIHDDDLDRTTNAKKLWGKSQWRVVDTRLAELKALDAGSWFKPHFAGTRIPTLVEALDTIQAGSITLIERKHGDPATCVALLKEKNLLDKVVVQSFDWDYLDGVHRLAPDLVLAALGEKALTGERLDRIDRLGARIVAWDDKATSAETIAAIHARGCKAWVWTVDDPQRIGQLVAAKIDGIITNRPAQTRQTIETALPAS
jgi:glycerophosphoryl diester phosphodiesterase